MKVIFTRSEYELPGNRRELLDPKRVDSSPGEWVKTGRWNAWRSRPGAISTHWLTVRLEKPVRMNQLILVTLPRRSRDGNRHGVRDFDLEIGFHSGATRTVSVRGNEEMIVPVSFSAGWVQHLTFRLIGANLPVGDQVSNTTNRSLFTVLSIQGWQGSAPRNIRTNIASKIERGPTGCVGIFTGEDLAGTVSGIEPRRLAAVLAEAGFGVNLLSADDLSAEPGGRLPFDCLVNLSGKNFPAGSWLLKALSGREEKNTLPYGREEREDTLPHGRVSLRGCHLVSVGALAFSEPWVRFDGRWQWLGLDLGLTATAPDWVRDHASRAPEQLRIDTTRHRKIHHAAVLSGVFDGLGLNFKGPIAGHAVTADLGEILSIDQDAKLARHGLWSEDNVRARRHVSTRPLMYGVWDHNYNPIHQTPCARFVPLLQTAEGPVGAAIINYAGRYAGSRWGLIELDDFSGLDASDRGEFYYWLAGLTRRLIHGSWFAFLRTDRYGLRRNESCTVRTGVACGTEVKVTRSKFKVPPDAKPGVLKLERELKDADCVVDRIEAGILVRDDTRQTIGPKLSYIDNRFRLNGRGTILFGSRTDGFHQWGQPDQEPLAWDRLMRRMRTMGLRVFSPVHVTFYERQGRLPAFVWDILETQAELCQWNGLVFAPCLFFPGALESVRDLRGTVRLVREFGRRMKRFRGIILYLYDDGLPQDSETFNRWAKILRRTVQRERPGTLVTAEFVDHKTYHALIKETARHLDFLAISHHAMVPDPLPAMWVDSTLKGKATTNAEFGIYDPDGSPASGYKYRLNLRLGIAQGQGLILNWMLQDPAHAQFPWGCLYAHDAGPKSSARYYQAEVMMVDGLQPLSPTPPVVAVLVPLKRMRFDQLQAAEVFSGDLALEEKLRMLLRTGLEFQIINEEDLSRLDRRTRWLVIPRLIDPDEALAKRLKAFAGTILWQRDGFRPDPPLMKRLARCRILDSSGPWDFAAQVHRAIRGKSLTGPVDPRYLLCRRFRELNYYLLADLPDGNGRPEEGEIRLENSRIRYRFDEDHLGVLLMRRGKLMGLAGFKQLWVNGEKILDCPGYFYARSRDGRPLGQTASPVTASFLPGAHRLKVNGSFRLF